MNKLIIILLSFFVFQITCSAQIQAVTSSGDEVTLYSNGTWKYNNKTEPSSDIPLNKTAFEKPAGSTFKVKSATLPEVSVSINPKKWDFKKSDAGSASEFSFDLKAKDAYAMIITERVEIPLLTLRDAALKNARSVSPDIEVIQSEYRTVNGVKLLYMQMEGSIEGVALTYYGYYYSYSGGSIQLLTYTSKQLAKEYKPELDDLLNGLVVGK
jgi:hypothetical protein